MAFSVLVAKASSRKVRNYVNFLLDRVSRANHKSVVSCFSKIRLVIDTCCDLVYRYEKS